MKRKDIELNMIAKLHFTPKFDQEVAKAAHNASLQLAKAKPSRFLDEAVQRFMESCDAIETWLPENASALYGLYKLPVFDPSDPVKSKVYTNSSIQKIILDLQLLETAKWSYLHVEPVRRTWSKGHLKRACPQAREVIQYISDVLGKLQGDLFWENKEAYRRLIPSPKTAPHLLRVSAPF